MDPVFAAPGGGVYVYTGPMFSGKTTRLLDTISRLGLRGKRCLLLKYTGDIRYHRHSVTTHDGVHVPAMSVTMLGDVPKNATAAHDCIAVDEGHFFNDIGTYAELWASQGKIVLVAGLIGNRRGLSFRNMADVLAGAESVVKLNAVCESCRGLAIGNVPHRHIPDDAPRDEFIGGKEKWRTLCRKCIIAVRGSIVNARPVSEY